eukprot:gnl/MRDRNA2_/MRDRNA2_19740_c0_seq1.p1 gnl/MRDRNA2_/MRDRNA2_19740_c0~~gnl/MRDRNA2_/MRDRNA2_19740_c0_seq1.p1  ORF type:complete len:223 (+),score=20.47 gnl/MRDRNA2_/MRDRNA2_19740_c0_seq1:55-669(+)
MAIGNAENQQLMLLAYRNETAPSDSTWKGVSNVPMLPGIGRPKNSSDLMNRTVNQNAIEWDPGVCSLIVTQEIVVDGVSHIELSATVHAVRFGTAAPTTGCWYTNVDLFDLQKGIYAAVSVTFRNDVTFQSSYAAYTYEQALADSGGLLHIVFMLFRWVQFSFLGFAVLGLPCFRKYGQRTPEQLQQDTGTDLGSTEALDEGCA